MCRDGDAQGWGRAGMGTRRDEDAQGWGCAGMRMHRDEDGKDRKADRKKKKEERQK